MFEHIPEPVTNLQLSYVDSWINESNKWCDCQAYLHAARLLDLKEGDVHVDIGTGLGNLLVYLKKLQPETSIISIDRNEQMLYGALIRLNHNDVETVYASSTAYYLDENNNLIKIYGLPEEMKKQLRELDLLSPGSPVTLVCDDIRKAEILKFILDRRKIDSGSFLFPGTGSDIALEVPRILTKTDRGDELTLVTALIRKVRLAAFQFFSEFTKEGGNLVIGERIHVQQDTTMDNLKTAMEARLEKFTKYWSPEEIATLNTDLNELDTPKLDRVVNGKLANDKEKSDAALVLCKLIKNDKAFK